MTVGYYQQGKMGTYPSAPKPILVQGMSEGGNLFYHSLMERGKNRDYLINTDKQKFRCISESSLSPKELGWLNKISKGKNVYYDSRNS